MFVSFKQTLSLVEVHLISWISSFATCLRPILLFASESASQRCQTKSLDLFGTQQKW